jgi:RNA polymerase sigma factor (sigma-70 family)
VATDDNGFDRLLGEWRAGSPAALGELLTRNTEYVRAAVRRLLPDRLRAEYDSLDFVQAVWASVADIPPERCQFANPDALVGFLAEVAEHKVIDVVRRRYHTQRRDIRRERPLVNQDSQSLALRDPGPSPSQWAIGAERWAALLQQLPPGYRAVAERLREGYTQKEIAERTGVSLRQVERIVRRLKEICGL